MSKRELTLINSKELDNDCVIEDNQNHQGNLKSKGIAIYHLVFSHENFEMAANHLFELVKNAQEQFPNQSRILFLDIEGHRNEKGGFDHDMYKLQTEFLIGFLSPFLKQVCTPLNHTENPRLQNNDVPDELKIVNK